jgi:hypothetical protein
LTSSHPSFLDLYWYVNFPNSKLDEFAVQETIEISRKKSAKFNGLGEENEHLQ